MFKKVFFICLVSISLIVSPLHAQTTSKLQGSMLEVYKAFKDLLFYLVDDSSFRDSKNQGAIKTSLETLSSKFHGIQGFAESYSKQPGFAINLKLISEMIDDAKRRFSEGNLDYSLWRLRTVSNHCASCHTSHKVDITFEDADAKVSNLPPFERGEFYLATRQLEKAKEAFYLAAKEPKAEYLRMGALRKWLIIYTRVSPNPAEAVTALETLQNRVELQYHESEEISEWLLSLKRWAKEGSSKEDPLAQAENLVKFGVRADNILDQKVHVVEILRATSLLHSALSESSLVGTKRAHALYLLGLCYSRLNLFFVNELPELYLEQCVREYPESKDALSCYNLYKDIVMVEYTGSSGTHLPGDVLAKLRELSELAQGVKRFDGRV